MPAALPVSAVGRPKRHGLRDPSSAGAARAQQVQAADPERDEEHAQQVTDQATAARCGHNEQRDPDPQESKRKERRGTSVKTHAAAVFRPATTITRLGAFLRM